MWFIFVEFVEVPQNWQGCQCRCSSHCQGFLSSLHPLLPAAFVGESGWTKAKWRTILLSRWILIPKKYMFWQSKILSILYNHGTNLCILLQFIKQKEIWGPYVCWKIGSLLQFTVGRNYFVDFNGGQWCTLGQSSLKAVNYTEKVKVEPDRQLRRERLSFLKLLTEVHCNAKLLSIQLACKKFGSSLVYSWFLHDTDHLCQYQQDSKPQQGFAEQGQFPREGSWLEQQPAVQSWFYTNKFSF